MELRNVIHLARKVADTLPLRSGALLPQADLSIPTADSQDVPGKRPGHPPDHVGEMGIARVGGVWE